MRPLRLYMEDGKVVCAFRVYLDIRAGDKEDMRRLFERSLLRLDDRLTPDGTERDILIKLEFAEGFSLGAVNVRIVDKTPEIRRRLDPRMNVSRAYIGARRKGILKLMRFIWRKPDVYINLAGRDMASAFNRIMIMSVIQHEFGHVLGFKDKYRYRHKKFSKRSGDVSDRDIMYMVGGAQKFMDYHIKRLKSCAMKGRLPFRNV